MKVTRVFITFLLKWLLLVALILCTAPPIEAQAQSLNSDPPIDPVKLIFIHHSCGENWLTDGNGNLGRVLGENNYFVSDTNYGWGPDSIGDATDYHNWIDWFLGPESNRYLEALYDESGTHADYTRPILDPGGENQIVLFKSCFPNSDLGGSPDDPPDGEDWYTVGHAKYIYNQLLHFFADHPEKLFIAITPPPLLDSSHAENARDFSRWLVEDWLLENQYPLNNVAVWDFHNVLTHPDNHHRIQGETIEYSIQNGNGTLYYDSNGDEHPNNAGNQKSTAEFVPMLNVFYHQWAEGDHAPLPLQTPAQPIDLTTAEDKSTTPTNNAPPLANGIIDDFESKSPPGTRGWEAFFDEATNSSLVCGLDSQTAHTGISSLRIDYHVASNGWATCPLFFETPPGYGNTQGLSLDYHTSAEGLVYHLNAHGGTPEARSTYVYTVQTLPESVGGWVHLDIPWDQIVGVAWEGNPGMPINPEEINGLAFGFEADSDHQNIGTLWIDNLSLLSDSPIRSPESDQDSTGLQQGSEAAGSNPAEEPSDSQNSWETEGRGRFCPGSTGLIAGVLFTLGIFYKPRSGKNTR